MSEQVFMTLTGRQRDDAGEEAVTTLCVRAEYYEKNGAVYLLYEELPEEGGAPVRNILKLKNGLLEQTKRGSLSARMVFETGKEHMTDYVTPYGRLKMGILTESVESFTEKGYPQIRAKYTLTAEGRFVSSNTLTVSVRPFHKVPDAF